MTIKNELFHTVKTFEIAFASLKNASDMIIALMTQPITPYKLEFVDEQSVKLINSIKKNHFEINTKAAVLLEIDGDVDFIDIQSQKLLKLIHKKEHKKITIAENKNEIEELWKARKSLSPALKELGGYKINEDIAVPISNLTKLLDNLSIISKKYNIKIVNFGHAGNGNIHVNLIFETIEEKNSENAKNCLEEIFDLTLDLNGTISGEHGIGIIKKSFLEKEVDKMTLDLMNKIKKQFDPKRILNPNKSI